MLKVIKTKKKEINTVKSTSKQSKKKLRRLRAINPTECAFHSSRTHRNVFIRRRQIVSSVVRNISFLYFPLYNVQWYTYMYIYLYALMQHLMFNNPLPISILNFTCKIFVPAYIYTPYELSVRFRYFIKVPVDGYVICMVL